MAHHLQPTSRREPFDPRDREIKALRAQLKAEQETRDTLIWAIRNGVTAPEVLEAIADDPVPAIVDDEDAPNRRWRPTHRKSAATREDPRPAHIHKLRG